MATQEQHSPAGGLQRTPLYQEHEALGARLVEFGGWLMPVQYSSIIEEHRAVRGAAGIFDVSHMGEFNVTGPGALSFLEYMVPNSVGKLTQGQALYSQICNESGGTIDDLLVYFVAPDQYMVVVNAGTMAKDWQWFTQHAAGRSDVTLTNNSANTALIAVQGPQAVAIVTTLTQTDVAGIPYYHFQDGVVGDIPCRISRTGYTGEDGVELYHSADQAVALWRLLLATGKPMGLLPCGLGARDTLRLEAGLCLYGHELTEEITPLEADLGWSVRLKKEHAFIGREALSQQKALGVTRRRVGIVLKDRGIARADSLLLLDGQQVGILTSGTVSITLGSTIGMGFVTTALAVLGMLLTVEVRGRHIPVEVVPLPFYKRQS